jgi:hypothetical protein
MTEVPKVLKEDNWALYVLARSHDPALVAAYARKFISSLIVTM